MTPRREATRGRDRKTRLEVDDVSIHFGGVKAVNGVSLVLEGRKIYGLLGPNGSGKSTLLAGITRLVSLTSGRLTFDGQEYRHWAPHVLAKWGMARTFQTVRLLPDLSVEDNVMLGADSGLPRVAKGRAGGVERRRRAREAIERVGLTRFVRHRPSELPYGLQRRVEIARAVAMGPRMLLLDEPTAGMSKPERSDIAELLSSLRAEGLTQLVVEHDVQMLVDICDHLFAMNVGEIVAEGSPDAVVRDPTVQEAYLGKAAQEHA